MAKTCFAVISDQVDDSFTDLTRSLRAFCPEADIAWYNSGPRQDGPPGLITVPQARPLKYAKITPAFFDLLEWAAEQDYDHVINVETDMAFIKPRFAPFVEEQMADVDYLAPGLRRNIPEVSQWPAYRSLRAELPEFLSILGMTHTNRCFNPGQVWSRKYVMSIVSSATYPAIRDFVERNQRSDRSFTPQELILPTLADRFDLRSKPYPPDMAVFNRYRPFQGPYDLTLAQEHPDAYFLHPVSRSDDDQVRRFVRGLLDPETQLVTAAHAGTGGDMSERNGQSGSGTAPRITSKDLNMEVLRGEDLSDAELTGANLREANLDGAFLASVDLRDADLGMSFMNGVFLKSSLLTGANLGGACLRGADLREVDLCGAFLNGADLSGAFLGDAVLTGADLREAKLAGADLREADLSGADLTGADLRGALLNAVKWTSATSWPDRHAEEIQAASLEDGRGVFLIQDAPAASTDIRIEHPYQPRDRRPAVHAAS